MSREKSKGRPPRGERTNAEHETRAQTRLQTQGNEPHTAPENGRVEQRLHADSPRCQNALTWIRIPGPVLDQLAPGEAADDHDGPPHGAVGRGDPLPGALLGRPPVAT